MLGNNSSFNCRARYFSVGHGKNLSSVPGVARSNFLTKKRAVDGNENNENSHDWSVLPDWAGRLLDGRS